MYQVPNTLLKKLAPIVCHGTRSDQVLISSDVYQPNTEITIPVDSSIQELTFEVTGQDIDYVTVQDRINRFFFNFQFTRKKPLTPFFTFV